MGLFEHLQETAQAVRARSGGLKPKVGIILGSGLGDFAQGLENAQTVPYAELPHFPRSSVQGHAGQLVVGSIRGAEVVAMQGRVHAYEGFTPEQVVYPARVLCTLGIRTLVVTNAAGGIHPSLRPGDLMTITDHINLSGWNPLAGPNDDRLGPRFPDLSAAYDPALVALISELAAKQAIPLKRGVYAILSGPSYETPAEIRALKALGADAVGMSTVPEVIAAVHMGVRVAGLSCITNLAAGISQKPLSHTEVGETAQRVKAVFGGLLSAFLPAAAQV